jgi:prepilin-type N-terminal cleavage/methylation domain-containing protein
LEVAELSLIQEAVTAMKAIRMRAGRKGDAGFSLVEIIVAIAVLSIGILAMIPMMAFKIRANTLGRTYGYAIYLAQERLEQIRSWPLYGNIDATRPGLTTDNTALFGTDTVIDNWGVTYTRITSLVRNGYFASGTCGTDTIKFTTGGTYDEGYTSENSNLGTLNTGNVGVGCSASDSSYTPRGEEFKMVRVRVQWTDRMGPGLPAGESPGITGRGTHEIERNMFVAGF